MRPAVRATTLLAVLVLSACSTAGPGSSGVESAGSDSPAGAVEGVVDTIVLASDSILLMAGDEEIMALDVADAPAVASALTELLGEPAEEAFEERECASASTVLRWGDALQLIDAERDAYADLQLTAFASEVETRAGGSIAIESPGGIGVGDDIGAYIAAVDPALTEGFPESIRVVVDRGWPGTDHPVGVVVYAEDGAVMNMSTPDSVNSGRDC